MKKILLLLIVFSLLLTSLPVFGAYDVSERVRIGIKYGGSAVSNPKVSSTTKKFEFFSIDKKPLSLGTLQGASVSVAHYKSYLVAEQSYFGSITDAFIYCNQREGLIPYIKEDVIYAVYHELMTLESAQSALEGAKAFNETAYIIEPDDSLIKVSSSDGKGLTLFSQSQNRVLGIAAAEDGLMDFGNQETYRDIIEFVKKGTSFNIISNITMQHYLYSVVPAEIGASAPLEAQKAQAVCARTYYEKNTTRHKSDGFALCATTHCQMYIGTKWEREQSNRAVDETENMIITYKGTPITSVYFAHSGGATANVEDVWGSPYDYLKSVEDKYCTDYTWEVELDLESLTKKMKDKGYNIGTVTGVKITEVSDYGLVTSLVIEGTDGSKEFKRESARTILGLKSQNFTIPSSDLVVTAKTKRGTEPVTVTKILTADGLKDVGNTLKILNGAGALSELKKASGNVIYGKGNGHHVGFSQHGAMEYAKNDGWDYITILKHYYQGVEIEGE
ncbi:MAG: SpoIID/LytB domain-containing protein [Ruminococcaceae bacterium]|nr:SpoIID/LytB domain-containing protein [Oscillospiraceae bacterium]